MLSELSRICGEPRCVYGPASIRLRLSQRVDIPKIPASFGSPNALNGVYPWLIFSILWSNDEFTEEFLHTGP